MSKTHSMTQIPAGMSVQDILPVFAGVTQYVPIGSRHLQKECASCRKPFNAVRRQHQGFRLFPSWAPTPIKFEYYICRKCDVRYRANEEGRNSVLAAVETFMMG